MTSEVKLYTRGYQDIIVKGFIDKVINQKGLELGNVVRFSVDPETKKYIPVYDNRVREFYPMTSKQLQSKFKLIKELMSKNINDKISNEALEEISKIRLKLKVVELNNKLELAVVDLMEREFVGTKEYPLNKVKISRVGIVEDVEDAIVEFQLVDGHFVAYKVRNDKFYPNNTVIAENVWNMLNDPITEEIITGKVGGLLRKAQMRFIK